MTKVVEPTHEAEAFAGVSRSMVESPSRERLPVIADMPASFNVPPDRMEAGWPKDVASSAARGSEDLPPSRRRTETVSERLPQPTTAWPGTGNPIGWSEPPTRSRILTPGSDRLPLIVVAAMVAPDGMRRDWLESIVRTRGTDADRDTKNRRHEMGSS